jgi:valyl-tRNA synthetase
MRAIELEKVYDPKSFEDRIYGQWEASGAFKPADVADGGAGSAYVIALPPPNVTGVLHLGHALDQALQDSVIRFQRMCGQSTLWIPGTDHAGIATQNVVEKRLRARGESRRSLGREKFVAETWKVKAEHHAVITRQMRKMGVSVDWSRERFTMDEGLSKAVRDAFVTLYERGLLYKGQYLVNWCTSCGTALSDDEVEHEDVQGKMYHLRYPCVETDKAGVEFIEIATTRPETLLGDTAVAVNPDDDRYRSLVGRFVHLPLTGRDIPVIADSEVDKSLGTGALKVTPAHAPADWEIAKRHGLPAINILRPDGCLNDDVPEAYRGLSLAAARERIIADLEDRKSVV